jgi:hypothetical protein
MHITIDVPETLPRDVVQELLQQFEDRLKQEARQFSISSAPTSKWARIAREAHDASPLHGVSEHVITCSREIRENFAFQHDMDTP